MKIKLAVITALVALHCSCTSITDREVGINEAEMSALKENYYWEDRYSPPSFEPRELEALMDRSSDPSLDGEYAEGQSSAVAAALATVGDERFSTALSSRRAEVQVAVIKDVQYMWEHYKLRYPKTQAIAQNHKESEQAGAGDAAEAI